MGSEARGYRPKGPLDPVAAAVAQAFPAAARSAFPIEQTRAGMRAACAPTREAVMESVDDHGVPMAGGTIAVRIYRPVKQPAALIAWAHGGACAKAASMSRWSACEPGTCCRCCARVEAAA